MGFLLVVLLIWIVYLVIYKKLNGEGFMFTKGVLPLVLFSILVTLDLGINFVAGSIPSINDGIGIYGTLSYLIIGEGQWSTLLFLEYYRISFAFSMILLVVYIIIIVIEKKKKNRFVTEDKSK